MSTLRLVNGQPINTLPEEDILVFFQIVWIDDGPLQGSSIVKSSHVNCVRDHLRDGCGMIPIAWSYTATFEPETTTREQKHENPTT